MDKSNAPYPDRNTENNFEPAEHRLNASRESIRQRLNTGRPTEGSSSETVHENAINPINSWSSLLLNLVAPSAKNAAIRHPYTLIAGSAIIGAYLAWSRPWRGVLGSVLVGTVVRNLVTASVNAGSKNGGRILRNYLNRNTQKKYPPYQKQEHAPVSYDV